MNKLNIKSMRVQAGFTLIELIVVIVILGVLAATALPKFADLGGDARYSKMQAALGAMKAASATFHAQWLVAGSPATPVAPALSTILQEGVPITYVNGFPDAAGIVLSAGLTATDYSSSASSGVLTVLPDVNRTTCSVTYTEATSSLGPLFAIAATASNCK